MRHRKRQLSVHGTLDKNIDWMDMSSCAKMSDIHLVRSILLQKLSMELVDMILDFAEYWPHTSSILKEPIRAFGPFTWRWNGGKINYSSQWSPSGPAYAHRWSRWGESRTDNSFVFRSPRLGVRPSRLDDLEKKIPRPFYKLLRRVSAYRKVSHDWIPPRGVRVAKKIVFEVFCHQDYFGTRRYDPETIVRLFCDVSIHRRSVANDKVSTSRRRNTKASKNRQKTSEQDTLVTYKPLILERCFALRHDESRKYVVTWSSDGDLGIELPSEEGFPTAHEFLEQLEVGDSIGVWARVGEGETYHIIDGMRMHVFWAV